VVFSLIFPRKYKRSLDYDPNTFDHEQFELEKKWLLEKRNDNIITVETSQDQFISNLLFAILWGLFFGSIPVMFIIYYIRVTLNQFLIENFLLIASLFYLSAIVFLFRKFNHPYSYVEFSLVSEDFLYKGTIEFAGKEEDVRYLGSIEIIEKVEVVRKIGSRRKYLRFTTNSGYLRMTFGDKLPIEVKNRLINLGLLDANTINYDKPIEIKHNWNIYYKKEFDRKEFFEKLKEKRQKKKEEKIVSRVSRLEKQYEEQLSDTES
jgi:hypothetical protein